MDGTSEISREKLETEHWRLACLVLEHHNNELMMESSQVKKRFEEEGFKEGVEILQKHDDPNVTVYKRKKMCRHHGNRNSTLESSNGSKWNWRGLDREREDYRTKCIGMKEQIKGLIEEGIVMSQKEYGCTGKNLSLGGVLQLWLLLMGANAMWLFQMMLLLRRLKILEAFGATVERVRAVSITHKDHYVKIARRRAVEAKDLASNQQKVNQLDAEDSEKANGHILQDHQNPPFVFSNDCKGGFFADQFGNLTNFRAHYEGAGLEIWKQISGKLDAFVAAAVTGGTFAGVYLFLQEKNPKIKSFLVDPPGSELFNRVTRGVMYTHEEAEGRRLKNPFDTITEGVGITEEFYD
ncbi:hypothetical protein MKW98_005957, partial [Papaver atlanticum]